MSSAALDYMEPPDSIKALADAPAMPSFTLDPTRKWALLVEQPSAPPIEEVAAEEVKLGGIRFDPDLWTPAHLEFGLRPRFRRLLKDDEPVSNDLSDALSADDIIIQGLPPGAGVRWMSWRPGGGAIAFVVRPHISSTRLELWCAEFDQNRSAKDQPACTARPLIQDRTLHSLLVQPHKWTADGRLLVKVVPTAAINGGPPPKPPRPAGPNTQENLGLKKPARTYQDLLKSQYDVSLFQYYLTSELLLLPSIRDHAPSRKTISPKDGALLRTFSAAPDNSCLLCTVMSLGEHSFLVPYQRFGHRQEIWGLEPGVPPSPVSSTPLQESVPIERDARTVGPRSMEALDGGDPKAAANADGKRDALLMRSAKDVLAESDGRKTEGAHTLFSFERRWSGWWFTNDGVGLLRERRFKDRSEVMWRLEPDGAPTQLWERMYQDKYNDPGSAEEVRNELDQLVLQTAGSPDTVYFMGSGASARGNRPFVDKRPLTPDAVATRVWRCAAGPIDADAPPEPPEKEVHGVAVADADRAEVFENPIYILGSKNNLLLLRRESNSEPPNYFLRNLSTGDETQLTAFRHPQPQLAATKPSLITYSRADGVELNAKMFLPAGYEPSRDGPRPCLMWAYPGEFKDKKAAGQVSGSPYTFTRAHWSRPLMFLEAGWVVLERFGMPILGEGDAEPNDTFVEQVVMNAEAACAEVVRRGVTEAGKIAVGGHSYGAFMTAHLLAHTDLFAAGIARSGAYNRTLTPNGFQAEERDYWHAMETYTRLSPFTHALKLAERKAPLLLIHGENDQNAGTHPMQSERMYQAIAGLGGVVRLVLLPAEAHGYKARESIMHVLHEQHAWLQKWVVESIAAAPEQKAKKLQEQLQASGARAAAETQSKRHAASAVAERSATVAAEVGGSEPAWLSSMGVFWRWLVPVWGAIGWLVAARALWRLRRLASA